MDTVRKYQDVNSPEPVKEAVRECIKEGILAEYLSRKGSEVVNMLIAEYDYETDIRVKQEEAREEGREEGIREGLILAIRKMCSKNFTTAQIADVLDESPEFVEGIIRNSREHPDWSDEEILNVSRER